MILKIRLFRSWTNKNENWLLHAWKSSYLSLFVSTLWWSPYPQIKILSDSWCFINKNWFNSYLPLFHYRAHTMRYKMFDLLFMQLQLCWEHEKPRERTSGIHLVHHPALTQDQLDLHHSWRSFLRTPNGRLPGLPRQSRFNWELPQPKH